MLDHINTTPNTPRQKKPQHKNHFFNKYFGFKKSLRYFKCSSYSKYGMAQVLDIHFAFDIFQFFVRLDHIRKCFTQKGGIFILEEFSTYIFIFRLVSVKNRCARILFVCFLFLNSFRSKNKADYST